MPWFMNADGEPVLEDDHEKLPEVSATNMTVFGVSVVSRYNKVREVITALEFLCSLDKLELHSTLRLVKKIYSDGSHNAVAIALHEDRAPQSIEKRQCIAEELRDAFWRIDCSTLHVVCGDWRTMFEPDRSKYDFDCDEDDCDEDALLNVSVAGNA
jgi:hypothetical protein